MYVCFHAWFILSSLLSIRWNAGSFCFLLLPKVFWLEYQNLGSYTSHWWEQWVKEKYFLESNTSWDQKKTKKTWANSIALAIVIPICTFADKTAGQSILAGIFPTFWHSPFVFLQMAMDQAHRQNLSSLFLPVFESVNPCLIVMVRRDNIVGDAMEVLRKTKNVDYKKPLKVLKHKQLPGIEGVFGQTWISHLFAVQCSLSCVLQVIFVGEEAVDAGGVRKEFFLLIMRELLDPKYGMFRYYEESRLIWFSDKVGCDFYSITLTYSIYINNIWTL